MLIPYRVISLAGSIVLLASGLGAQEPATVAAASATLPDAPGFTLEQEQSTSRPGDSQSQQPGPDPKLPDSSVPQQNFAQTPVAKE